MTHILGISGKIGGGKSSLVNSLYCIELNEQNFSAHVNDLGQLVVITDVEKQISGILDINDKRSNVRQFLDETIHPFIKNYNLADLLKEISMYLFGLSYDSCYGTDEQKNQPLNIQWGQIPGVITKDYKEKTQKVEKELGVKYHKDEPMTGRTFLQYFATEICRRISPDCWINFTLKKIQDEQPELALVSDIRFINEVKRNSKVGGKVIRLTRQTSNDQHRSETELDNYTGWDAMIDNQNLNIVDQAAETVKKLIEWGYYKQV